MKRKIVYFITLSFNLCFLLSQLKNITSSEKFFLIFPYIVSYSCVFILLIVSFLKKPKDIDESPFVFWISLLSTNFAIIIVLFGNYFPIIYPLNQSIALSAIIFQIITIPVYLAAIFSLGGSFAILPEVHEIKLKGLYRYFRHPIYLIYICWFILQILFFQTYAMLFFSIIQIILVILRAKYEEKILSKNNKEYSKYLENIGWLGPVRKKLIS